MSLQTFRGTIVAFSFMPALIGLLAAAASGCRSPAPVAPQPHPSGSERLAATGQRHMEAGSFDQAVRLHGLALEAARTADNSLEITRAAANLAVSLAAAGRLQAAAAAVCLARAEAFPETAESWTADLITARLAALDGDCQTAANLAGDVFKAPGIRAYPLLWVEAGVVGAQAAVSRGDAPAAAEMLTAVRPWLSESAPFSLHAAWQAAAGNLARLRGQMPEAAAAFDRTADSWRDAGRYHEMALSLETAGEAWLAAGQSCNAAERYFRAGRSLRAAGQQVKADLLLRKARATALQHGHDDLLERIEASLAIPEQPE